ncbi:uncharacterized protein YciI [Amycolatopsis endophytica]|uniref:Uncharacterized protein YciI n=1 Tax=Amycolatopsis endophytica TaxID=860233 RepID=A0A853BAZ7_9PSEU|nr:YciI family protein [Amycolatopsis endophytica]NYI92349.1 uncharacterized protein YciI [Amycolatopsis endophytica]
MTSSIEALARTRQRLATLETFAIFMRPTDEFRSSDSEEGAAMLVKHLEYLFDLEDRGLLLASGPLDFDRERIEGMCMVAVASRSEAERIATREPFHQAGWRVNEVRSWRVNEGTLIAPMSAAIAGGLRDEHRR